jgi:flagellar biosynthetic protein FlhB
MAENQDGSEKKHLATDKKRSDASDRGQIARSQDANALGVIALTGFALLVGSGMVGTPLIQLTSHLWQPERAVLDMDGAREMFNEAMLTVVLSTAGPLLAASVGALGLGLAQSQGRMAPKALEPKIEKLDPFKGFKSAYLSWTPLVELAKGLGKLILLGGVVSWGIYHRLPELPQLAALSTEAFIAELIDLSGLMLMLALPVIAVIAAADYAYASWKTSEDLKMTDEELRRQNKEQEGDPQWKSRRRQRARQIAMGTMIQALREADVLVTNPTHYAIALRYDRTRDAAPIVVAKGVDHLALHLRAKAKEFGVPQMENRPLARALHANVEVGHPVPEDLYGPVAKVLAVIFRKYGEQAARSRANKSAKKAKAPAAKTPTAPSA